MNGKTKGEVVDLEDRNDKERTKGEVYRTNKGSTVEINDKNPLV